MELKELEQILDVKQKQIEKNIDRCCKIAEQHNDDSTINLIGSMVDLNHTHAQAMVVMVKCAASEKAAEAYKTMQLAVIDFMVAATEGMAEHMEQATREGKK